MEEHRKNSPKKRSKLESTSDEETSNNFQSDELLVTYETQAPERRLQPTIATSKEHTVVASCSSTIQMIRVGIHVMKNCRYFSPIPPNFHDKPTAPDRMREVAESDLLTPRERVPVEINPEEKLSMTVINKCPECYKIMTMNVTTHLRGRPNMSTRVVFKVVSSCKEPWCEELFALNSMWDVPVRADNFRNTQEDLELETTKELLHACPKCLSTSTK